MSAAADTLVWDKILYYHWKTKEKRKFLPVGKSPLWTLKGSAFSFLSSSSVATARGKERHERVFGWCVWQFSSTCKQELCLFTFQWQVLAEDEELCHLCLAYIKVMAQRVFILQMWPLWWQSVHLAWRAVLTRTVLLLPTDQSLSKKSRQNYFLN